MSSAMFAALDLSKVAFAKLHSAAGLSMNVEPTANEPRDHWSVPGLTDAQHGSRPRSEGFAGDPACEVPSFEHRGHPVSSREGCSARGSLERCAVTLEGAAAVAST